MGMPRGLIKSTHYWSTVEAWKDWAALCVRAHAEGHGHLIEQFEPPEGAGHRTVDKAIAKMREAISQEKVKAQEYLDLLCQGMEESADLGLNY